MYIHDKPRQIALIISASLAGFMSLLDGNIVNISLPYIAQYFHVGTNAVVQVILVYMVVMAGTMIIFGKLADQFGVKRVFISGFVIFTISSLLCGFATSLHFLVLVRAVQATGASMLFATGLSLITAFIPPDRRGWAFGIFSPLVSLGMLVGNPLGGLITGLLDWHWIFLINVPVGVFAVALAWKAIPNTRIMVNKSRNYHFDIVGSLLSFSGLVLLVFCLNQLRKLGWESPVILAGLPISLILLLLFFLWEKRAADPLLDLSILKQHTFSVGLIISLAGFGLMAGSGVIMPFMLAGLLQVDVEHAGFILMTFPVVFSVMSPLAGNLSDHLSRTRLMSAGMLVSLVSTIAFILLMPHMHLWIIFVFLVLQGIAYAFFITPNNNFIMSVATPGKESVCSSVFKLSTNLGQMFGILVMEMLFSFSMPAGFSEDPTHPSTVANETLVYGFQLAYVGGAVLCLLALLLVVNLKDLKIGQNGSEEPALMI